MRQEGYVLIQHQYDLYEELLVFPQARFRHRAWNVLANGYFR